MMNRLARYAMGSVNFEVTGGRGERFLNDCVNAGVPVEHLLLQFYAGAGSIRPRAAV